MEPIGYIYTVFLAKEYIILKGSSSINKVYIYIYTLETSAVFQSGWLICRWCPERGVGVNIHARFNESKEKCVGVARQLPSGRFAENPSIATSIQHLPLNGCAI